MTDRTSSSVYGDIGCGVMGGADNGPAVLYDVCSFCIALSVGME